MRRSALRQPELFEEAPGDAERWSQRLHRAFAERDSGLLALAEDAVVACPADPTISRFSRHRRIVRRAAAAGACLPQAMLRLRVGAGLGSSVRSGVRPAREMGRGAVVVGARRLLAMAKREAGFFRRLRAWALAEPPDRGYPERRHQDAGPAAHSPCQDQAQSRTEDGDSGRPTPSAGCGRRRPIAAAADAGRHRDSLHDRLRYGAAAGGDRARAGIRRPLVRPARAVRSPRPGARFRRAAVPAAPAGVEPLWHQIETVRKVLKQFRGRVLLADEVGLGKTIEAGMVLKEYMLRGMAEHILVLVPAALVGQWREEMENKFGIAFATSHDALLRDAPAAFWAQQRIIASIAAARRTRTCAPFARAPVRCRGRRRGAPSARPIEPKLQARRLAAASAFCCCCRRRRCRTT